MKAHEALQNQLESLATIEEKAYGLFEFWLANRGKNINLIKDWLNKINEVALAENSIYALGWVHYIWGWIESDLGNYSASFPFLETAREKFEECGDKWALSKTMNGLGANYYQLGVYEKALENLLIALELAEEVKDNTLISSIAINIGNVFAELKQYTEALYYYEEVVTDLSHLPSERAIMLCNIGAVYKSLGRYSEAEEKFKTGIELNNEGVGAIFAYQELGGLFKLQGQNDEAYKYFKKCLALAQEIGVIPFVASALFNLGDIEKEKGQLELAQKYLEEALQVAKMTNSESLRSLILKKLAEIYREVGRVDEAHNYLDIVIKYQEKSFNEDLVNNIGVLKIKQARRENFIYHNLYNRINTISSIGRAITASLNVKEVGKVIYEQLNELLTADNLLIGLYSGETNEVDYKIIIKEGKEVHGFTKNVVKNRSIEIECLKEQKGIIVNALSMDEGETEDEYILTGINSLICCPLLLRGKISGFIMVQSKKKDVYSDYHLDI